MGFSLMSNGPAECGKLERFADFCQAPARSFWLHHRVKLLKQENDYTLKISASSTVTDKWMDVATKSVGIYAFGLIIAPAILVLYGIACIPVAISTSIGSLCKRISLARDENSQRYHTLMQKCGVFCQQSQDLRRLEKEIESDTQTLQYYEAKLVRLKKEVKTFYHQLQEVEADNLIDIAERNIAFYTPQIKEKKALVKQISNSCSELQTTIETLFKDYLTHKEQTFEKLSLSLELA